MSNYFDYLLLLETAGMIVYRSGDLSDAQYSSQCTYKQVLHKLHGLKLPHHSVLFIHGQK